VPIDFTDPANRTTYSGRTADPSWHAAMGGLVDARGRAVADVGCGGGVYAHAWLDRGAARVVGVDSSEPLLGAAREAGDRPGLTFTAGDAAATGLAAGSVDVVFERALVHHIADLGPVAAEAFRVLTPGGRYVVQDRVADDVTQAPSARHVRGWFFAVHPRLLDIELARRPSPAAVSAALTAAGFTDLSQSTLWETRRVHADREELLREVRGRVGRSILHELDDTELDELVERMRAELPAGEPVVEQDRWTVWTATRPR